MSSSTAIANLALSHLGAGKEISSLESDRSNEGNACRRFYEQSVKQTLRDFAWPFATKILALGLVEEDPNDEWAFSYRYPSDCLKFRRILSGMRNDTRDSRVPYRITRDDAGLLVFTDSENAEGEYTIYEDNPERYPSDFVMAVSLLLAAYIAPRVTGGDPFKMGLRAMNMYLDAIKVAQAAALNEEQAEKEPDSEFIRGRE